MLKALATTRKILVFFANELKDAIYNAETPWFLDPFPNRRSLTLEDRMYIKEAEAKRALFQLRRKKFIETRKQGNKIMYRLTDKGRMAALKDKIRLAEKRKDKKLVIISFDIPEQERGVRSKLRYLLKDLKFVRIQHSLWASEQDIGMLMSRAIADVKADKWVRIFEASEIK